MANMMLAGNEAQPRLHFIDFGLARRFDTPVATWAGGRVKPPEVVQLTEPATYDPFKADVYALAMVFSSLRLIVRLHPAVVSFLICERSASIP